MNFSFSFQSKETPQQTTHSAFLAPDDQEIEKPERKKLPQISSAKVTEALIEDPNIYEFDSIYDEMKEKKEAEQYGFRPKEKKPQKRESRYIEKLKKEVERRKIETQIAWEKMESKERRREEKDPNFQKNQEETYLTQSYLKMMAINKEKQAIYDIQDKINEKKTGGNLSNFYSKLLSKNSAMGGGLRNDEYAADKKPKKKLLDRIEDAYEDYKQKEEKKEEQKREEEEQQKRKKEEERKREQRERSIQRETQQIKKEEPLSREEKLKRAKERYKKRKEGQKEEE